MKYNKDKVKIKEKLAEIEKDLNQIYGGEEQGEMLWSIWYDLHFFISKK